MIHFQILGGSKIQSAVRVVVRFTVLLAFFRNHSRTPEPVYSDFCIVFLTERPTESESDSQEGSLSKRWGKQGSCGKSWAHGPVRIRNENWILNLDRISKFEISLLWNSVKKPICYQDFFMQHVEWYRVNQNAGGRWVVSFGWLSHLRTDWWNGRH